MSWRLAPLLALVSALLCAALPATRVRADPDPADRPSPTIEHGSDDADLEDDHGHRTFDYSRFSDGPRRVPVPRGASRARAEQLGLGTRDCASRLLHQPVPEEWSAAARGRSPSRLLWPVDDGDWVRGFGYVRTTRPDLIHRGVDIHASVGTVVRAAADGIVAYSDNGVRGYGNLVMIVHANGWVTLYAHNSRTTVQPGYRVRRGERIALVGQTGIARGPHVHFELWEDGRARDPAPLFDGGPRFVQRIAAREAARGRVPPPAELTPEDRPTEAALAPHPDDAGASRSAPSSTSASASASAAAAAPASASAAASESATASAPSPSRAISELGTLALAQRLLARAPSDALLEHVEGRVFSSLLFPVRDGTTARPYRSARSPMQIASPSDAPIRAAADGLVAFAGELPGRGASIVVVHRTGWVTAYVGLGSIAVEPGAQVERGAWIGRAGGRPVELELRVGGTARDPAALLVTPVQSDPAR